MGPTPSHPPEGPSGFVAGIREEIRSLAIGIGFDRVGFAAAETVPHAESFRSWLAEGFHGGMEYLARNAAKRIDPALVVPGVRTVIAMALHYAEPGDEGRSARSLEGARAIAAGGRGEISRYAQGADYHRVLEERLRRLCAALARRFPDHRHRYYVDTGPVLERAWAEAAGIGWIGKNACAIDAARGSYFFIGVVLTTLDFPADEPADDHCGSCRLCIDACPTQAIVAPYRIDARRCISYLNIEHRGSIPLELREPMGGLVFGCDICQEVCPFNRPDRLAGDPELAPRPENRHPPIEELASLTREAFSRRFPRSAVKRAKAAGLARNAIVAIGNSGRTDRVPFLKELSAREDLSGDPVLAETLRWAIEKLERPASH